MTLAAQISHLTSGFKDIIAAPVLCQIFRENNMVGLSDWAILCHFLPTVKVRASNLSQPCWENTRILRRWRCDLQEAIS